MSTRPVLLRLNRTRRRVRKRREREKKESNVFTVNRKESVQDEKRQTNTPTIY